MKILVSDYALINKLYEVLDQVGNLKCLEAVEIYHELNQYLLAVTEAED